MWESISNSRLHMFSVHIPVRCYGLRSCAWLVFPFCVIVVLCWEVGDYARLLHVEILGMRHHVSCLYRLALQEGTFSVFT